MGKINSLAETSSPQGLTLDKYGTEASVNFCVKKILKLEEEVMHFLHRCPSQLCLTCFAQAKACFSGAEPRRRQLVIVAG